MPKRKQSKSPMPLYLLVGGGIALIAAAVLMLNQGSNTPAAPIAEDIPYPEIARVSIDEARAALEAGTAVLVDVRSAEAFAAQRIAGSINIPAAETQTRLTELDPNAWIIPYCT